MRKYFAVVILAFTTVFAQSANITMTTPSGHIELWGSEYHSGVSQSYQIRTTAGSPIRVDYNLVMEVIAHTDYILIKELNSSATSVINSVTLQGVSRGTVILSGNTGKFDIELHFVTGPVGPGEGGLSIDYSVEPNMGILSDAYVVGQLSVGTSNMIETLNLGGAIRGADANGGNVLVKTDNGTLELGPYGISTTSNRLVFNKPITTSSVINPTDKLILGARNNNILFIHPARRVGIGTESPTETLDVRGTIRANEIKVNIPSGADFVFDSNYPLLTLTDLERYISEHQHLPEVQSASEMEENGVSVSEFQIKLLQKVEELTIYILQQNARIQQLEQLLNEK